MGQFGVGFQRVLRYAVPMFVKGQKVVCVNDQFPAAALKLYSQLPKKDSVYTVRSVYIGRGNYTLAKSGQMEGEIGLLLEELINPRDPSLKANLTGELGFNSERFAPLVHEEDELDWSEKKSDEILLPA